VERERGEQPALLEQTPASQYSKSRPCGGPPHHSWLRFVSSIVKSTRPLRVRKPGETPIAGQGLGGGTGHAVIFGFTPT
jgi:hypothetical protein